MNNFSIQRKRNDFDEHVTLERKMLRAGVILYKLICVLLI